MADGLNDTRGWHRQTRQTARHREKGKRRKERRQNGRVLRHSDAMIQAHLALFCDTYSGLSINKIRKGHVLRLVQASFPFEVTFLLLFASVSLTLFIFDCIEVHSVSFIVVTVKAVDTDSPIQEKQARR